MQFVPIFSLMTTVVLASFLVGCGASTQPQPSSMPSPTEQVAGTSTTYCLHVVDHFDVPCCVRPISSSAAARVAMVVRLDQDGQRVTRMTFLNGHGAPTVSRSGCSSYDYVYQDDSVLQTCRDRNGRPLRAWRSTQRGKLVLWQDGWGHPRRRWASRASAEQHELDDVGRVIGYRYVDASGRPVADDEGVHETRLRRNHRGVVVQERYFDVEGQPMFDDNGVHRRDYEVDEHGNQTSRRYFDVDGAPTRSTLGPHELKSSYDEFGNLVRESCLGLKGEPVPSRTFGAHARHTAVDEFGDSVEARFYDGDGKAAPGSTGAFLQRITRDARGRAVRYEYFDEAGRLMPRVEGFAVSIFRYDDRGNEILWEARDAQGRLVTSVAGYASKESRVDRRTQQEPHRCPRRHAEASRRLYAFD